MAIGDRLKAARDQRGWTQEHLAEAADFSVRTIQRIESGPHDPGSETILALAAALDVEVSELRTGLTSDRLAALQEEYLCPTCGAVVVERVTVPHEYGDDLMEVFECRYTRGWNERPCPSDPRFPTFEDYDLTFREHVDGGWLCLASGKTRFARQVSLDPGRGRSQQEAEIWVRRSYVRARDGHAAGEKYLAEQLAHFQATG
jgi:transcriptional regulator with XRE-family HTH domain